MQLHPDLTVGPPPRSDVVYTMSRMTVRSELLDSTFLAQQAAANYKEIDRA